MAGGIEHLEVHPATRQQPFVRTTPPLPVIEQRKDRFDADKNAEEPARDNSGAEYLPIYLEYGTVNMTKRVFFWAAATLEKEAHAQRITDAIQAGVDAVGFRE